MQDLFLVPALVQRQAQVILIENESKKSEKEFLDSSLWVPFCDRAFGLAAWYHPVLTDVGTSYNLFYMHCFLQELVLV